MQLHSFKPQPPRIQGRRWLVVEFDDDDEVVAIPGLCRFSLWAQVQARNLENAAVVDVEPAEANQIARSAAARRGDLIVHEMTLSSFCRQSDLAPTTARRCLEKIVSEGSGLQARIMRRKLLDRTKRLDSASQPTGIADLLVEAMAVLLGPNATLLWEHPRDWDAIKILAQEIVLQDGRT